MGTARWHEETCVRSIGENCTICVDQCPMGEAALVLNGNRVVVKEEGCTGCGAFLPHFELECIEISRAMTVAADPARRRIGGDFPTAKARQG